MIINKILLIGREKILNILKHFLKTPEELELIKAQATKELSEASKNRSEAITNALKEIAEARSLELQNLERAIGLFERLGQSEEKIQELVGPQLNKLLQTHDDLLILKQAVDDGVILDIGIRQLNATSKS